MKKVMISVVVVIITFSVMFTMQNDYQAVSNISLFNRTLRITVKELDNYMEIDPISPEYKFSYVIITSIGNKGIPLNAKVTLKIIK